MSELELRKEWNKHFNDGNTEMQDKVMAELDRRVEEKIKDKKPITADYNGKKVELKPFPFAGKVGYKVTIDGEDRGVIDNVGSRYSFAIYKSPANETYNEGQKFQKEMKKFLPNLKEDSK